MRNGASAGVAKSGGGADDRVGHDLGAPAVISGP